MVTIVNYTPEMYLADLKVATTKALASGASLSDVAAATMAYSHSVWDECYGTSNTDDLLAEIKARHPKWGEIQAEAQEFEDRMN